MEEKEDPIVELFRMVEAKHERERQEVEAIAAAIGHNGGPSMAEPFGINSPWFQHAQPEEVERLAKLHVRIERRKAGLRDVLKEREKIMMRCVRRMRRAQGKE